MKSKRIYALLMIALVWLITLFSWIDPDYAPAEKKEEVRTEEVFRYAETVAHVQEEIIEPELVYEEIPLDPDIQEYMHRMCDELNISYAFALAMMESESGFRADAVGDAGESIGYMQINRCNWEWIEEEYGLDVSIPEENVAAGLYMLRRLFEQNDDPYRVIICYKAGETRGDELYEQGIFKTKDYDCAAICERAEQIEEDHEKENRGENDRDRSSTLSVLCKRH